MRFMATSKIRSFFLSISRIARSKILCVFAANAICTPLFSLAQNRDIDSLLTLLKNDKADTRKVIHLLKLATIYSYQNLDSAIYFAEQAKTCAEKTNDHKRMAQSYSELGWDNFIKGSKRIALDYYFKALKIYVEQKNKTDAAMQLGGIAIIYDSQGDYSTALDYYFKTLKIAEEIKNQKIEANTLGNIGIVYDKRADYNKALDYYFKALKIKEILGDKSGIANQFGSIGNIYGRLENFPQALEYYFKALKIEEEKVGDKNIIAGLLGSIGIIYMKQGNYNKALDYNLKSLKIAEELGDKEGIAITLRSIAGIYREQADKIGPDKKKLREQLYKKAFDFNMKSLKMIEELGNKREIALGLINIGSLNITLGKFKEAEKQLQRAAIIGNNIGTIDYVMQSEELLSKLYDTLGRSKEALVHYKKAMALKDSLSIEENKKQLVRKEMNYEFDKKETATKAENEKQQAIAQEKNHKQKIISWLIAGGLLLALLFSGFVFRSLRTTRKQKDIIELQKNEATQQKHIVEEKQKEIVDSITYAKRIQTALLTSEEYINEHLPAEHFILFKPKDIVSGDFYWALSMRFLPGWDMGTNKLKMPIDAPRKNIFYMATADCTGHGVPGAFMSMLNISYLNENIMERGLRLPNEILNSQREKIIQALNPKGSIEKSMDGMDCILCAFDFDKMLLHFAAANNPLWLVRNGELTEYKADKMPVGRYNENMDSFTLQTIPMQKGDIIYTSTDGYADQFNARGKKLMKKTFKEQLLKIHGQSMSEQKKSLNQFFENWKGNIEQVDDVCIIGVRI